VAVETLLIIFAFVITLSMSFQAFFLWRLATSGKNLMDRLNGISNELEKEGKEVIDQLRGIVDSLEHLRRVSEGVDIDQLVGRLVEVGSMQAEKVDDVISDTVEKFEATTALVQQDIVRPVVEISSIVKGLKTGLQYLFAKKKIGPDESYPEDELFI
jgi:hypothetical protein